MVRLSQTLCQRLLACWGNGDFGRLGHGASNLGESIPRVCSYLSDVSVAYASCGGAHTVVLTDNGAVFSMGLNEDGQLGHSAHAQSVPVGAARGPSARASSAGCYWSSSHSLLDRVRQCMGMWSK